MILVWYHWAILGLIFMGSELLIPAFVLVWFGLGACLVAGYMVLFPVTPFILQMTFWLTGSLIFVALWFTVFKNTRHKTFSGRASAEIVGEIGLVIDAVDPFHKGRVRFQQPIVGSDVWDCIADQNIGVGSRVKVASIEGNILKVTLAESQS